MGMFADYILSIISDAMIDARVEQLLYADFISFWYISSVEINGLYRNASLIFF